MTRQVSNRDSSAASSPKDFPLGEASDVNVKPVNGRRTRSMCRDGSETIMPSPLPKDNVQNQRRRDGAKRAAAVRKHLVAAREAVRLQLGPRDPAVGSAPVDGTISEILARIRKASA
jgi:hypothetical protein